jgi:hypothetical protein
MESFYGSLEDFVLFGITSKEELAALPKIFNELKIRK